MVAAVGWMLLRWLAPGATGMLETAVAWLLCFVGVIVGSGLGLGYAGALNVVAFWLAHAGVLGLLLVWRRRWLTEDRETLGRWAKAVWHALGTERGRVGAWTLLLVWLALGALAALAHPVVYDALAYRLPRIGQWLQDGRIGFVNAEDPRLNYMPLAPDLVMAWLLAPWSEGFRPAALAQWLGGGLVLGATLGLARESGLSHRAAIGAAMLVLGLANVAPQFTSLHTDLFTTGILGAAFYLWWRASARGEGSWLGGLGAGLAVGAKGTVFYLAPAALLWVVWLARRHPMPARAWQRSILAGLTGLLVFAAPTYSLNWKHYGGPFGPAEHVTWHHQGSFAEKIGVNTWSALIQGFDPQAQPWPLRDAARAAGLMLAQTVPDDTRLTWGDYTRRGTLEQIMRRDSPDADVTPFGLVPLLLFALAMAVAARRWREPGAQLVLVWGGGLVVFFLFFHGMQRWHPFGYRYLVLMAPWLGVVAAWGLEQLPSRWHMLGWSLALLAAANVFLHLNLHALQAGWRAVVSPERVQGYFVAGQWGTWFRSLDEPRSAAVSVALPYNLPLAGYYRTGDLRAVRLMPLPAERVAGAEQLARAADGWVIVPAVLFMGREGRVMARTWLEHGEETGVFSVAAYRPLRPGETEPVIVYRQRLERSGGNIRWSLLLRPAGGKTTVALRNPGTAGRRFTLASPAVSQTGEVPAGGELAIELSLAAGRVSEILVDSPDTGVPLLIVVPGAQ